VRPGWGGGGGQTGWRYVRKIGMGVNISKLSRKEEGGEVGIVEKGGTCDENVMGGGRGGGQVSEGEVMGQGGGGVKAKRRYGYGRRIGRG